MRDDRTALLVFARAPRPGCTKTRLIPALGAAGAARLHERMVEHAVREATASCLGPVTLLGAPDVTHGFFAELATRHACALRAQPGGDLGARMVAALGEALAAHRRAILLGSDCPSLAAADLCRADSLLAAGADVALGPAADGGYVLVAMREPLPDVFRDIAWGTDAVMRQTRERMRSGALSWSELPERVDIDEPGDLQHLPAGWVEKLSQRSP